MRDRPFRKVVCFAFGVLALIHFSAYANSDLTFDGLQRVDSSDMDEVWVRPGFDPGAYSKIMFRGAGIHYAPASRGRGVRIGSQTNFAVDTRDRLKLEEVVSDAFRKELVEVDAYEVVDASGPDTLLLVVSLIDVVSHVPKDLIGRHEVYLSEVGSATLVLEFRDSESGAILVRGADRRAARRYGEEFQRSSAVTNWATVRRLAQTWASGLRKGIDDMKRSR